MGWILVGLVLVGIYSGWFSAPPPKNKPAESIIIYLSEDLRGRDRIEIHLIFEDSKEKKWIRVKR